MSAPDVTNEGTGALVISSEEGETDHLEEKIIDELGMIHGARLTCDDFLQNFNVVSVPDNQELGLRLIESDSLSLRLRLYSMVLGFAGSCTPEEILQSRTIGYFVSPTAHQHCTYG